MKSQQSLKTSDLRALSLKQPWLYAITHLGKRIENRTWFPPQWVIGQRIALHASKSKGAQEWEACEAIYGKPITVDVPTGAIVAVARVANFFTNIDVKMDSIPMPTAWWIDQEKWYFARRKNVGWVLDELHPLDEPIPCRGMLSLWQVPDEIAAEINRQLLRDDVIKATI